MTRAGKLAASLYHVPLDKADVLDFMVDLNPNDPPASITPLVDSAGEFVLDPSPGGDSWDWGPLDVIGNTNNATSRQMDIQQFAVPETDSGVTDAQAAKIYFCYLVSRDMVFNIRLRDRRTSQELTNQSWWYNWSNAKSIWSQDDNPQSPVVFPIVAGSHKNNGKGFFLGNIGGLDALN